MLSTNKRSNTPTDFKKAHLVGLFAWYNKFMRSVRLYIEGIKLLFRKYVLRQSNGVVVKKFATKMGIAYIKFAQILAMQNFGDLFTEDDRKELSAICDNLNPIPFSKIKKQLEAEFLELDKVFVEIDEKPLGSASVSQVHRAVLKSGEVVAIKIKRKDVAKTISKDVKTMRRFVHRFGFLVGFKNYTGGDKALDLWLSWIEAETDFLHEKENIRIYQDFADSVNGKIAGAKKIVMPKVYGQLCTENVLVMEYIPYKTVNQLPLTKENKEKIRVAMDSYLQLSFYAMFHDLPIIFHGDPHGGNIYIDDNGNMGFLDMGLLAQVPEAETELLLKFFLTAYSKKPEKLYDILVGYGEMSFSERERFREDCKEYTEKIKTADITHYFVDMMNICLKYEFLPPEFLFMMAKAFVCLYGINGFSGNITSGTDLVSKQVAEFLIRRGVKDCKDIIEQGFSILPKVGTEFLQKGLTSGVSEGAVQLENLLDKAKGALANFHEVLDIVS